VRACGLPLVRETGRLACPRGHAYDIARSGYVNLLQPQDRRSLAAGDAKGVVQARADLIAAGVGRALIERVAELAGPRVDSGDVAIDLGCGTGDALAALADRCRVSAVGIDLSATAADLAARRFPGVCWVVANADRRLPLVDESVAIALSLHGRRNAPECARVLGPRGQLIVTVPAGDDLVELRTAVHGRAVDRSRERSVRADYDEAFTLVERLSVREHITLLPDALRALLRVTYRGARSSAAPHLDALASLDVTLASDIYVFKRR
jgi:23S rRNA (guanine745-N1)-methyltransferase